jgi:hypothetical protein
MTTRSIDEIRAELRAAEQAEATRKAAARDAIPITEAFTIEPIPAAGHHEVWDPTITLYRIAGRVTNREEAAAAGHHVPSDGGMVYAFNTLTGKIVMGVGGGTYYISGRGWGTNPDKQARAEVAFTAINEFIATNPTGGDITSIVQQYRG